MNELDTQAESVRALCLNKILPNVMMMMMMIIIIIIITRTNRGGRDQIVDFINMKDSFFHRKQSILVQ
jgi:hypothetical protein